MSIQQPPPIKYGKPIEISNMGRTAAEQEVVNIGVPVEARAFSPAAATPSASNRDWTEDFRHENGNYFNTCCECNQTFVGHKRRVVCRQCAPPAPTPNFYEQQAQELEAMALTDMSLRAKNAMNAAAHDLRQLGRELYEAQAQIAELKVDQKEMDAENTRMINELAAIRKPGMVMVPEELLKKVCAILWEIPANAPRTLGLRAYPLADEIEKDWIAAAKGGKK